MKQDRATMSDRERAVADLEDIDELRRCPAFAAYYDRRQREKIEALRKSVLEDDFTSPQELWEARLKLKAALDMTTFMAQDENVARAAVGVKDGESPVEAALLRGMDVY